MQLSPEKRVSLLLLASVVIFNVVALWPETSITRVDKNDNISHFTLIQGMVDAVEHGQNPLDFWSPETVFGYPEVRVYQPLAHGLVAVLYFALGKTVSLMTIFVWVRFLSLILFPVCYFVCARMVGLPNFTAAAISAIGPLISAYALYGLEWNSFLWSGFGLFPQAVAANLLLLAIGFGFQAVLRGKRVVLAGVLLGLTALSELVYGYMGALTLCLIVLLPGHPAPHWTRIRRTIWVGLISLVLAIFQLLPPLLDHAIMNRSVLELSWKWDSWGALQVMVWLFTGELLDNGRLPVLTLLAFAGAGLIVWQARRARRMDPTAAFLLLGASLWILIFFGRPFWGPALWLVGVFPDMPLHRVIAAVQIFLVLLAGVGLERLCRETARRWGNLAAALVVAVVLLPVLLERAQYVSDNNTSGLKNLETFANAQNDLDRALAVLRQRGGRVYPGLANNWGRLFGVGAVPAYLLLTKERIPTVSYLAHSLALPGDLVIDFDELRPDHYRLFNIQSLLAPAKYKQSIPKLLIPRLDAGQFVVFDAPGGGYFDVVDAPVVARINKEIFYKVNQAWIRSAWPEHKTHLWIDLFGNVPPGLPVIGPNSPLPPVSFPASEPGQVTNQQQNGDIYQASVDVSRASYVLFKMTWHPNWKVLIDGKPVKTVMLSPGFLGAPVTPGRHQVWCRYEPGNWKISVAFAGVFCVLLLGAAERFRYLPGVRAEAQPAPPQPPPPASPEPAKQPAAPARRRKRRASVK